MVSELDLTGKAGLVTGASSGIGYESARMLAEQGMDIGLIATSKSTRVLEELAQEIVSMGRKAIVIPGDVSDEAFAPEATKRAVGEFGRIDTLVNAAGIADGDNTAFALKLDELQRILDVNTIGAFLMSKSAVRQMRRQKEGSLIFFSSVVNDNGGRHQAGYNMSKGAVVGLMRSMATDHAGDGIRSNAIAPGAVDTPMLHSAAEKYKSQGDLLAMYAQATPLCNRLIQPREVAGSVVYLASNLSSMVTGQIIRPNGGMHFGG